MDFSLVPRYLESPARQLFRRCLQCPDSTPSCPACNANEECSLNVNTCNQCGYAICIQVSTPGPSSSSSTSSPAGPIAGGVIGGIILVGAIVFLVYWFYMRPKRKNWAEQLGKLKEIPTPDNRSFIEERSKRASTHTVASVKTTGSRASIPIAFIPGVTNGGGSFPHEMVPPVPPIPAAGGSHGTLSPRMNTGTEVFFRPESSYSDIDTRSITGRSTRSSVASEFHDDAIANPMPAQAAMAYKPTTISVSSRSNPGSPSRSPTSTPPLSHQSSIASRMRTQGPITGQSGQARQIMITRSQSNLRENNHNAGGMNTIAELDDTSNGAPTPRILASELDDTSVGYRTPKLGVDRSGTASPRSMLSDDAEEMMRDGRWRKPSLTGGYGALKSPDYNHPPVSAAGQSTFSRNSPVSAVGWDPQSNIRNTIRDATSLAYGNGTSYGGGKSQNNGNQPNSPFADRHAMNN